MAILGLHGDIETLNDNYSLSEPGELRKLVLCCTNFILEEKRSEVWLDGTAAQSRLPHGDLDSP